MALLFIQIKLTDIIDILLVAYLIYALYKLIKGTVAIRISLGIFTIYLLWKLVGFLEMRMINEILNQFISIGFLALIIVFQPELRKFLLMLGNSSFYKRRSNKMLYKLFGSTRSELNVDQIIQATEHMADHKIGALIVVPRINDLDEIASTGEVIDANISSSLITTIFYKNNPLHDGAMVIQNNRIKAVRCVLPLTDKRDFPAEYGLRHRAALGVTESTDAFVVVVSEQTGNIAIADKGKLEIQVNMIELKRRLIQEFKIQKIK